MNEQQRRVRQQELEAKQEREASFVSGRLPLNCAPGFWDAYRQRPGMLRRRSLVALFKRFPLSKLPVNNRWQANTVDPDLRHLMKQGILVQVRGGGGRRHPLNKSARKRQSYLMLAEQVHAVM
ncbi:hypothetical protein WJ97_11940 [Burkholderia ubonensis]|uniref:hypothetical protein n=1 Tax=Burkholderia ubonensis TaxID=101571 RepID=UPI00075B3A2E|nr:hypothetical protein [Burkholderia ubonensis]KVP96589.1 hypothetical protein WJ97_11940 [Burkholderia ubonensis]